MDRGEAFNTFQDCVAEVLDIEPDEVRADARWREDLDADSLAVVEITLALNDAFSIKIPDVDSLLVGFGPGTKVTGWDSVPPADRPPVVWLIHLCFDAMVGLGFLLLLAGLWAAYSLWRHRWLPMKRSFWALGAVCGVAAIVERIRARLGDSPVYVSVDIDVLAPAHAPGTGTPEAGGLTSRELLAVLRGLRGLRFRPGFVHCRR